MIYDFYKFPDLDADIGLFADGGRIAVHLASQGGAPSGGQRNRDRRKAFERLLDVLPDAVPSGRVLACRAGRSDTAQRQVDGSVPSAREALNRAFADGEWFRFDFWLSVDPPLSASEFASKVGLNPMEHASVRVIWPEAEATPVSEEAREAFVAALDEAVRAVPDPSHTGSGKWRHLEQLIADNTGLRVDEVVVGYVSEGKHVHNRRRQRWGQASLRLLLTPDPETTRETLATMEDAAAGKIKQDCAGVAVATITSDGWRIVNVLALRSPSSDATLRLAYLAGVDLPSSADDDLALAASILMPIDWLREILWLLEDKKGIVFYGPPGTGKTFIAQQIGKRLQPDPERRMLVQLHPSYGYEEFFEGYRPASESSVDGEPSVGRQGVHLKKLDGPLKILLSKIDGTADLGLLVLDEMNRANLPRVFGELYFLLEYRDRSVRLMYSPEQNFSMPEGFRIIGTMNTADRSVALLDQALRRRFHFIGLFPDQEPVKGLLRRYLRKWYGERMDWLADVLERANAKLDRNVAVGPSHFMRSDLDEDTISRIWKHSVLPSIEDHYFGQEDRMAEFALDALRSGGQTDVIDPPV
jgi:dynein-related subfamily AAA family protein